MSVYCHIHKSANRSQSLASRPPTDKLTTPTAKENITFFIANAESNASILETMGSSLGLTFLEIRCSRVRTIELYLRTQRTVPAPLITKNSGLRSRLGSYYR